MKEKINVLIVGTGLTSYVIQKYLKLYGINHATIGPSCSHDASLNASSASPTGTLSPKFQRADFLYDYSLQESHFPGEERNFLRFESSSLAGLSAYWGANMPSKLFDSLDTEISSFIHSVIPLTTVDRIYETSDRDISSSRGRLYSLAKMTRPNNTLELIVPQLAIEGESCIPCGRCMEKCSAIFSSISCGTPNIKGVVQSISYNHDLDNMQVSYTDSSAEYLIYANYIILASGAVSSYRIASTHIAHPHVARRIKHHPLITTLLFIPNKPALQRQLTMSNLDILIRPHGEHAQNPTRNAYCNIFPVYTIIKSGNYKKQRINLAIALVYHLACSRPLSIFTKRLYICNIYLSDELSASYISVQKASSSTSRLEVNIDGGFRSDIRKVFMKYINPILGSLWKYGIFKLPFTDKLSKPGADMHYAATLCNEVTEECVLKSDVIPNDRLFILDSSILRSIPVQNPTPLILGNAIRLLRDYIIPRINPR
jgi:ferredoxin